MSKSYGQSRMYKMLVVGLAVSAALTSTACSRKSGGQKPVQATQGTTPPAPREGGELDKNSGTSAQETPIVNDDEEIDNEGAGLVITDDSTSNDLNGSPQNSGAFEDSKPVIVHYDPTGMLPSQIFEASDAQGAVEAGELSDVGGKGRGLRYSGAGQDDLREQLLRHERSKSKTRRARDQSFARTINQATFDVDWASRSARISILMNGRRHQLNISSHLGNDLVVRSGSVKRGNRIAVEAVCMDRDGGCETVYMKVQDGSQAFVRTAHLLVRTTRSTLNTQGNGYGIAKNLEYDYLLSLLLNTVNFSGQPDSINSLYLRTTEVIGGVSNYIVQIGTRTTLSGQSSLNFTGALVKPANSSSFSAPSEILQSSSPIAGWIRDTRLVRNDGRG
ncbi:MAG: hypothetical protein EOP05_12410, partial [Proteobacteria bacterium]